MIDVADLLSGAADSRASMALFRDSLICNWLLAAPDAHAKNYSLLMDDEGYALAPLYDVCSSAPYAQPVSETAMAMTVGDAWTVGDADDIAAWADCTEDLGLDMAATLTRVDDLCEAMPAALAAAADDLAEGPEGYADSSAVAALIDRLTQGRLRGIGQRLEFSRDSEAFRDRIKAPASGTKSVRKRRRTRCPHYGKRTRRRCIRMFKHKGQHRYR